MEFSKLTLKDVEDLHEFGYSVYTKIGQGTFSQVYTASYSPTFDIAASCVTLSLWSVADAVTHLSSIKRKPRKNLVCKVVEKSYQMPKNYPHRYMQRELNIMKILDHPYIPQLHSILRKGPKFLIFMPLAKGGNVCEFIMNSGPVKENVAKRWLRQLSLALIYLHTMDIAHRDISCDNVLLTENFNVRLTDFGYSCFNVTPHGWPRYFDTHCGSLPYVAPEVIRGLPYNPKYCDIWSLGVVLFVMLNGTLPFTAHSYERQYNDQMERNYSHRRQILKTITPAAIEKVSEMLEPNPLLRTSLQEILESSWMRATNSEVSSETRKLERKAQKNAKNVKEEMEMCRGRPKKFSIQYPWIKIEKEGYFERLTNLKKRHVKKTKAKSLSTSQDLHSRAHLSKSSSAVTVKRSRPCIYEEMSETQLADRPKALRYCTLS